MHALVYTGTQELVYREEKNPKVINGESIVKVSASGICGSDMPAYHGKANRRIPDEVIQVLDLVKNSHPMDALRTGISALAAFDPEVADNSTEATIRKGIRLT